MESGRWTKHILSIIGAYYLFSGLFNALFPKVAFHLAEMDAPTHIFIWQHVSVLFAVLGIGFMIAATNPGRYWPITFMGLMKMLLGTVGFITLFASGCISWGFGIHVLLADVIWLAPMFLVLRWSFNENMKIEESLNYMYLGRDDADTSDMLDQNGDPVSTPDSDQPILLVFLRHFGCVFCRETLHTISKEKRWIEKMGSKIVIVHQSPEEEAKAELEKFGLQDLTRVSDPSCRFYRRFGLESVSATDMLSMKNILRMMDIMMFKRLFQGRTKGDPLQMPGAFLVKNGQIINGYKHEDASDSPDYLRLATWE